MLDDDALNLMVILSKFSVFRLEPRVWFELQDMYYGKKVLVLPSPISIKTIWYM